MAIVAALRRGERGSCNCFGASTRPLGSGQLVRNLLLAAIAELGCGTAGDPVWTAPASPSQHATGHPTPYASATPSPTPALPVAGNPDGGASLPPEARAVDTADQVIDTGPEIVLDGGGRVTLDGGGQRRILYLNTCDQAQVWTSSHCQDQDHPRLVVQNLTFRNGDATGDPTDGGEGGAVFVRGGRFKVINSRHDADRRLHPARQPERRVRTRGLPGMSFLGAQDPIIVNSTVQ